MDLEYRDGTFIGIYVEKMGKQEYVLMVPWKQTHKLYDCAEKFIPVVEEKHEKFELLYFLKNDIDIRKVQKI